MKIVILCQFIEESACGIHMNGKAKGLALQGHEVEVIYHPFKYDVWKSWSQESLAPNVNRTYRYSRFFGAKGWKKAFHFPLFLLRDIPEVLARLLRAEFVIWHKALPLALGYALLMKLFRGGKTACVLDDWEGIGGMVSIRHPDSLILKMAVTLSEEWLPILSDGIVCSSNMLYQRFGLSTRTRDKRILIPLGAESIVEISEEAYGDIKRVVCVGTYKSKPYVDFLAEIINQTTLIDSQIHFDIVGGGDELERLANSLTPSSASKVILTGQIPHSQVTRYLHEANICLLYLNQDYPETFVDASRSSTKLFEYLSCGKAVVASAFGEPSKLLEDGKEIILCANSAIDFAKAISQTQKAKLTEIGAAGKNRFIREYSHEVLMSRLSNWIKNGVSR